MNEIKKVERMEKRNFLDSWFLPCSLRSHRTANPLRKMGFAIFRLYLLTTLQIQTSEAMKYHN